MHSVHATLLHKIMSSLVHSNGFSVKTWRLKYDELASCTEELYFMEGQKGHSHVAPGLGLGVPLKYSP